VGAVSGGLREILAPYLAMSPEGREQVRRRDAVRRQPTAMVVFARAQQIRGQAYPLMLAGAHEEAKEILRAADRHWYVVGTRALDSEAFERLRAATADPGDQAEEASE
jgi:hypothetical protein